MRLLLVAILLVAPARGADRELAKSAYRAAMQSYNLGQYRHALEKFREAYRAFEDSVLLFDIAQCHRQLGENEMALRLYRSYLRENPDAPNRAEVERLIATMPAEPPAPQIVIVPPAPPPPAVSMTTTVSVNRPARAAGIALLTLGAAAFVGGAALVGVAQSEDSQASSARTLAEHDAQHDTANALREGGWPMMTIGILSAVGGLVAVLVARRHSVVAR